MELLLAGVPLERVSMLLGHQSVRITEKHYAPWVHARQAQLEADVKRAWQQDPVICEDEGYVKGTRKKKLREVTETKYLRWWRRGESNPRPKSLTVRRLHAYLVRLSFRRRP